MRRVICCGCLSAETRYACCRPDFVPLPMGHTKQLVFSIVPDLVPVQIHGLLSDLLLQSWKLRSVAALGQFLSSRQIHENSTRKSAASCFLHSSLLVSVLDAPLQQSLLPKRTRSSNSARSFSQTGLASNSSAPSMAHATSPQFDCGEG